MMPLSNLFDDKYKRITSAIVFGNVLFLIVVLVILWAMPYPDIRSSNCGYMCLPCTDGPDRMCCGCRAEILQKFMSKIFESKYKKVEKEYKDMFNSTRVKVVNVAGGNVGYFKPMAHMIGENIEMATNGTKIFPIRKWQKNLNCLLLNGISFNKGRYRVPVSGFYHVYSAIDFSYMLHQGLHNAFNVSSDGSCLIHAIYKSNIKSFGKEDEVVTTFHPYEVSRNKMFSRYDTYLGGDVYLEAGEEVYVKVANISYAANPPKNVFGLHLI